MKTLKIPQIHWGSATELPYPDDFFDAVLTDPPYYDGTRSPFSTVAYLSTRYPDDLSNLSHLPSVMKPRRPFPLPKGGGNG